MEMPVTNGIHPESGCRLPPPRRDKLDERGQAVFDRQLDPARGSLVGIRGPLGIRLYSPIIAEHAQAIVQFYRTETLLDEQTREIAIITTARAHDSQFEWAAHAPLAAKIGVLETTIDAVRQNAALDGLPSRDALIISIGRQLFGERGFVELVTLMSMHAGTASLLAAFDMQLLDGKQPDLP